LFNHKAFWNSRPDGIPVLEIVDQLGACEDSGAAKPGPAPGTAVSDGDAPRLFVPLKRTELRGQVAGPLAALQLTQVYGYSRLQCNRVLEAVYRFPLPGDAAVTAVTVRFGDVEIQAELKEREKAEAEYVEAKRQGQQAALATRESPDVFTLQVAGLKPDQEVMVLTSYVQLAHPQGAGWSLRVPLTTSPRYVRSDELTSRHAQGQPLALLRDPGLQYGYHHRWRDPGEQRHPRS
jgi:Ca-activated chloride channel family protein